MSNLLAYIPTLNQRHLNWFTIHPGSDLYLITQTMAEAFVPRLRRNMAAVPTELMVRMLRSQNLVRYVNDFWPDLNDPARESSFWRDWVVADEDVSRIVAEKYLADLPHEFEDIQARWDMLAVKRAQPVIPDVVVSVSPTDNLRMRMAEVISVKSPDWWRQIGAVVFDFDGNRMVSAFNTHMPNEYETYIFGDPRLNVDAGEKGKYTSLHSEQAVIALCAKYGLPIAGASVYVNTFPCEECARWLAFTGVKRVFFREGYSVLNAQDVLRAEGVEIIQVVEDPVSA